MCLSGAIPCVDWEGHTPNIIKALRPEKRLYREALKIFYRLNPYVFGKENDWGFGDMKKGCSRDD
jgi:hypothetical protein